VLYATGAVDDAAPPGGEAGGAAGRTGADYIFVAASLTAWRIRG
jgi:hypothetical protein